MLFLKKKGFAFCVGVGTALSAVLCALLLMLTAFLTYKEVLGQGMGTAAACISAGGGVFGASVAISKVRGRQALPMGAALAAVFLLVAMIVRLCVGESAALGPWIMWLGAAVFCGGLLGAMLAAGKKAGSKRRHRRKRG